MTKKVRYTKKVTVLLTEEQYEALMAFADKTGDGASTLMRRLTLRYIEVNNK